MSPSAPVPERLAAPPGRFAPGPRRFEVDALRTFLTVLVICHHSAIAFGASGGWYFVVPPPPGSIAPLLLTFFVAVNQSFFMALFFAIAGYFIPPALVAKGRRGFLRDRFARLGLPLLVYFFFLNPLVAYLAWIYSGHPGSATGSVADFFARAGARAFGTGPLWFVLALLLFSAAYAALARTAREPVPGARGLQPPAPRTIASFEVVMGLAAFLTRLAFPVGWDFLGLQLGYFPLYIALFVIGSRVQRGGWLDRLDAPYVRPWFRSALVAILALPGLLLAGRELPGGEAGFRGGLTVQSFVYSMWEPILCVGISLQLLAWFRRRWSRPTPLGTRLARAAYAAYIVHPLLVVPLTAVIATVEGGPLLHFAMLASSAVVASFAAGDLLRRVPGLERIL